MFWVVKVVTVSIMIIFLLHNLYIFFKETLTVPKMKDMVKRPQQKYESLFRELEDNRINTNANANANTNMNMNTNTNHSSAANATANAANANATENDTMKNELKRYLMELNAPQAYQ
jgi:hypothetical protein